MRPVSAEQLCGAGCSLPATQAVRRAELLHNQLYNPMLPQLAGRSMRGLCRVLGTCHAVGVVWVTWMLSMAAWVSKERHAGNMGKKAVYRPVDSLCSTTHNTRQPFKLTLSTNNMQTCCA
jgi:hypothetical protein